MPKSTCYLSDERRKHFIMKCVNIFEVVIFFLLFVIKNSYSLNHNPDSNEIVSKDNQTEWIKPVCLHPDLQEGQRSWRFDNQSVEVILSRSNIACQTGRSNPCVLTALSSENKINFPFVQINIQHGDWLTLWFNILDNHDRNWTDLQVTISEMSVNGLLTCEPTHQLEPQLISTLINIKGNITIPTEFLTIGTHLLNVKSKNPLEDCHITWNVNVTVKDKDCSEASSNLCSGQGTCIDLPDKTSYVCQCCPGYIGKYCEERDACYEKPCRHGGFCVDVAEGLIGITYQCLCLHGFRGETCEEIDNLCDKKPCYNNGICHGNHTAYHCECPPGFTGENCATNINECLSNPCLHGMCEDGIDKYKCYCSPGYGGDQCDFEYDECDSNPCINAGACEDLIAGYRCHCSPGYKGRRCEIKVDLCQPNPCLSAQCVEKGKNYTCICNPGYKGQGCIQYYDPCYSDPCQNGGTCWPSPDSFYCSCLSGYMGDMCEEPVHPAQSLPNVMEGELEPAPVIKSLVSTNVTLNHLHNIFIGVATSAVVCLAVLAVVVLFHYRIHKIYNYFTKKSNRSPSNIKQQKFDDTDKFLLNMHENTSDKETYPDLGYEATSVDLVDNLNAPLIS